MVSKVDNKKIEKYLQQSKILNVNKGKARDQKIRESEGYLESNGEKETACGKELEEKIKRLNDTYQAPQRV
jgi:hypothetical protein